MHGTLPKNADLYRMVMEEHICPYGLKSLYLLEKQGYQVNDHHLKTPEDTDLFKRVHGVKTTPQTFIGGARVGGYDDLLRYFGLTAPADTHKRYRPVLVVFATAFFMALGTSYVAVGSPFSLLALGWFISFSMCLLAMLKLQDVEKFSTMFLNYDLLAGRWVPYSYYYAYAEGLAGILMTAHVLPIVSVPIALFIGSIGAASVIKAVYIDKRDLSCACVGGKSNVPLGFISLTENVMMVAMAIWMGLRDVPIWTATYF